MSARLEDRREGAIAPAGALGLRLIRSGEVVSERPPEGQLQPAPTFLRDRQVRLRDVLAYALPAEGLPEEVNRYRERNLGRILRHVPKLLVAEKLGIRTLYGALYARLVRLDGEVLDYGLVSVRVVTTAGVGFITDAFQNLVELELMRYHGIGTGSTAEGIGDTALVTELTTQYNPDNTRATGSQTENGANVYRTVGTNSVDAAVGVQEHGIFTQAATGGGTLLDRSVFSVINMASGDSLETTYDFTTTAGG